jgi:hypothetical protein
MVVSHKSKVRFNSATPPNSLPHSAYCVAHRIPKPESHYIHNLASDSTYPTNPSYPHPFVHNTPLQHTNGKKRIRGQG